MNDSKYKLSNFLQEVNVNGILEKDLVNNYWDLFEIKRPYTYITVSREFVARPDLLSYAVYGSDKFWWILMKANNLEDAFNDLIVENVLVVPDVQDIEDWFLQVFSLQNGV
jgi:hypothetical protein